MIFTTGDTHIPHDIGKLGTKNFPQQKTLTKSDFVVVLGDFGLIWKREPDAEESFWTKWLDDKPWTTLWLKGNHENHDRLDAMPITEFLGGKVHKISDSIYHLIDNQIFTIDGKKFYVLGGAQSTDKIYRREGISWWPQELPNVQKCNEVVDFITKHGKEVDYVVTHCFPTFYQRMVSVYDKQNCLTDLLTIVDEKTLNKKGWFCGHYHVDKKVDKLHRVLYNDIAEVV